MVSRINSSIDRRSVVYKSRVRTSGAIDSCLSIRMDVAGLNSLTSTKDKSRLNDAKEVKNYSSNTATTNYNFRRATRILKIIDEYLIDTNALIGSG